MHYGQQWQKVSVDVGRGGADCRDRYRNHIVNKDTRVFGASDFPYVHPIDANTV